METLQRIKLLLVDDEIRFLQTLTQRLSMRDFDVTPVSNGQDALDMATRQSFDLALVDLKMPGMDGEELLAKLKEKHPFIEVVILTGHGSIDSAVTCTRLGSHSYLQKPCDTEELLLVLQEAYQKRVQRRLQMDEKRISEILRMVTDQSPLAILRRLRELENERG
ncbi:MAG: response regulator [Pseudomonadota bacterium]